MMPSKNDLTNAFSTILNRADEYDDNQPRADDGKWTDSGGFSSASIPKTDRTKLYGESGLKNAEIDKIVNEHDQTKSLVVRYSPDIEGDIDRDWSAWMGARYKDKEEAVTAAIENRLGKSAADLYEEDDRFNNWDTFINTMADELDVRQDKKSNEWAIVHHDGLSVYDVYDSDSIKKYARKGNVPEGEGSQTVGKVKVIGQLTPNDGHGAWYLLESDRSKPEYFGWGN